MPVADGEGTWEPCSRASTSGSAEQSLNSSCTGLQDEEPRWDDGLSQSERTLAKKKFKNRKSAERWRRRKREAKQRTGGDTDTFEESASEVDEATESVQEITESGQELMLYEHSVLGKIQEADMLEGIHQLAAFSLAPTGFQDHKEEILILVERLVRVKRSETVTPASAARGYLDLDFQPNQAWCHPEIPNTKQICQAFASGKEGRVFVPFSICTRPGSRLSLLQLSQLTETLHTELYFYGMCKILKLLPQAADESPKTAKEAITLISRINMELAMLVTARILGMSSGWMMTRTIRTQMPSPIGSLMAAAVRHNAS